MIETPLEKLFALSGYAVSTRSGSDGVTIPAISIRVKRCDPVATARGTDFISN
jgi:hypothetical protein